MRRAVYADVSAVDVISDRDRPGLAEASGLTEALRLYDSAYHAEMQWWTAPYEVSDGIPHSALVSAAESDRVDVGRSFPVTRNDERRVELGDDRSTILVISAVDDARRDILGCGETLSAVLLEATMAGPGHLHADPHDRSRGDPATSWPPSPAGRCRRCSCGWELPPPLDPVPPPTPRRPLSEVLHFGVRRETTASVALSVVAHGDQRRATRDLRP